MSRKKCGGFIFETYANDHPPYHVHVYKGKRFLGRFDIEHQCALDERLTLTAELRSALRKCGYSK